ncbi:MAG TPA: VOC family protein [Actinomycetota bacterium]|nr:VOC family protein [Actinomycetota bacterium]
MALKELPCGAQLPVADLARAKRWYRDKLGLQPVDEDEHAIHYACGGSTFTLYPSAAAGTAEQTVLGWLTPDIEAEVPDLRARGVRFESYDLPGLKTDENGIADIGPDRVAWFKDSEGNVLGIGQTGRERLARAVGLA